jgi:small-conductance mechanosensitive channel
VTPGPDDAPRPLRTEPRSLLVHWAVITAVVFLAAIIVSLFLGAPWWVVLILAGLIGAALAPASRRADVRAMDARRAG